MSSASVSFSGMALRTPPRGDSGSSSSGSSGRESPGYMYPSEAVLRKRSSDGGDNEEDDSDGPKDMEEEDLDPGFAFKGSSGGGGGVTKPISTGAAPKSHAVQRGSVFDTFDIGGDDDPDVLEREHDDFKAARDAQESARGSGSHEGKLPIVDESSHSGDSGARGGGDLMGVFPMGASAAKRRITDRTLAAARGGTSVSIPESGMSFGMPAHDRDRPIDYSGQPDLGFNSHLYHIGKVVYDMAGRCGIRDLRQIYSSSIYDLKSAVRALRARVGGDDTMVTDKGYIADPRNNAVVEEAVRMLVGDVMLSSALIAAVGYAAQLGAARRHRIPTLWHFIHGGVTFVNIAATVGRDIKTSQNGLWTRREEYRTSEELRDMLLVYAGHMDKNGARL